MGASIFEIFVVIISVAVVALIYSIVDYFIKR
jgi:preprotein translocase subunit SecE